MRIREKGKSQDTYMSQINRRKRLTFFFEDDNLVPVPWVYARARLVLVIQTRENKRVNVINISYTKK
jgi:hypothetical protein